MKSTPRKVSDPARVRKAIPKSMWDGIEHVSHDGDEIVDRRAVAR